MLTNIAFYYFLGVFSLILAFLYDSFELLRKKQFLVAIKASKSLVIAIIISIAVFIIIPTPKIYKVKYTVPTHIVKEHQKTITILATSEKQAEEIFNENNKDSSKIIEIVKK